MECAQLVKANSIEGCKLKEVDVIYTRWRNLHKTSSMEVGAIGFHDRSKVKKIRVVKENSIVNALNRTKQVNKIYSILICQIQIFLLFLIKSQERFPNLAQLQEERAAVFRAENKAKKRQEQLAVKQAKLEREEQAKLRSFE